MISLSLDELGIVLGGRSGPDSGREQRGRRASDRTGQESLEHLPTGKERGSQCPSKLAEAFLVCPPHLPYAVPWRRIDE